GTWTMTTNNTYAGATTINSGTLVVAATAAIPNTSSVILGSGATFDITAFPNITRGGGSDNFTLKGSGTVKGNVVLNDGAGLVPGNSIGTLTVGDLTLSPYVSLQYELGTPNVVGGEVNDLVIVQGDLTL